jgi:parallel beta-helix repeat protein
MTRKPMWVMAMTLLLLGALGVVFGVQRVNAGGGIRIKADGSISPTTAPLSTSDNFTYTFTGTIKQPIIVERDNIIIDGRGFILRNPADVPAFNINGISLDGRSNVTIQNVTIRAFWMGIQFETSAYNTVSGVTITKSYHGMRVINSSGNEVRESNITANYHDGIQLYSSNNNSIHKNTLSNKDYAIRVEDSFHNYITENDIEQNKDGIVLIESSHNLIIGNHLIANNEGLWIFASFNNVIYQNAFINNTQQVVTLDSQNSWDNSVEGNYWGDYEERYPDANEMNESGIWDTPYFIDENNKDHYPIIPEFPPFLILPLFAIATLLTATVCKHKFISRWKRKYMSFPMHSLFRERGF